MSLKQSEQLRSGVEVRHFEPADTAGIIDLILPIQRDEFGIEITSAQQPDLLAIADYYQRGRGAFLVAVHERRIVGTAGLKDIGSGRAALRKMFVALPHRGRDKGVASGLLRRLLDHALHAGVRDIYLGTTDRFHGAHRFYEKNGFARIDPRALPESFPRMAVDTRFYHRAMVAEV